LADAGAAAHAEFWQASEFIAQLLAVPADRLKSTRIVGDSEGGKKDGDDGRRGGVVAEVVIGVVLI